MTRLLFLSNIIYTVIKLIYLFWYSQIIIIYINIIDEIFKIKHNTKKDKKHQSILTVKT